MHEVQALMRHLPPGGEVITGSRAAVVAEVRRGERRGELTLLDAGVLLVGDGRTVVARVVRHRPRPPAWRRPALIAGGAVVGVAVAWWLLWTLAAALATTAGMLTLAALAGVVLLRARRGGGGTVTVVQRVTIRR